MKKNGLVKEGACNRIEWRQTRQGKVNDQLTKQNLVNSADEAEPTSNLNR